MNRRLIGAFMILAGCAGATSHRRTQGEATSSQAAAAKPAAGSGAQAPQGNPFVGAKLWVDPESPARGLARTWRTSRPEDAAALDKIAQQPVALWIGDWIPDVELWTSRQMRRMGRGGFLPVFVVYNIPQRDCGQYSAGGSKDGAAYRGWVAAVARGIGSQPAVVILEPDGLPLLTKCLAPADQAMRLALFRYAIGVFAELGQTSVYVDAGHSGWVPAPEMAQRLRDAGIDRATGFSLNVSNFKATSALVAYGKAVSALVGDKPFILDTSRNGNGPPPASGADEGSWCNPPGRALGHVPTAETGLPSCTPSCGSKSRVSPTGPATAGHAQACGGRNTHWGWPRPLHSDVASRPSLAPSKARRWRRGTVLRLPQCRSWTRLTRSSLWVGAMVSIVRSKRRSGVGCCRRA